MASRVERELARQRKELIKLERRVDAYLVGEYRNLYGFISDRLDGLIQLIEQADDPKTSWLVRQWQYQQLLDDIERETARFAFFATRQITQGQRELVATTDDDAIKLIEAIKQPQTPAQVAAIQTAFRTLNPASFDRLVGNASNGKPLSNLLLRIAPKAKRQAERVLTRGMAQGLNPREVGRQLRDVTGQTLTRTQTIARTEMIRANREASLDAFRQSQVTNGWYWHAQLDQRTCFACAMMSGTAHTNAEHLDGHPNCRCDMIPKTLTWEELGFTGVPDSSYRPPLGEKWFDGLTEAQQRGMLGPTKYDALKNGELAKRDLIARPRSKEWGTMRRNASFKEAKRNASKRSVAA